MNTIIPADHIAASIHWVRKEKVILDRDLAELYGVETRALKQAVKRNLDRFPPDFMFTLSTEELDEMVSQNVIPSKPEDKYDEQFTIVFEAIKRLLDDNETLTKKKSKRMGFHP
jgi:hypothetical protein